MPYLHYISTISIAAGLLAVGISAFGLVPGIWLIGGVALVLAGLVKAIVFAIWNGTLA
ncbi:MAG TPA: hypothetical protein VGT61_07120 [Thermomicrobiales bacterium]|nr:hypothetical protein [Thermomicrobiales bacterium]